MLWRVAVRYSSDRHILQLPNGRDTSVGELKELFQKEDPSLPHDLRIVFDGPRGRIVLSDDKKKLSEYREIQDGTVFRLDLTMVYVQAVNGQKYKIPIGTDKFYNYPVSALLKDVERVTRFSLTNHKLFLRHKPLLPTSLEGKALTLTDYAIRKEDTLLIQKESSDLNITNSQVDLCFMVDCTGSMASHIEAVKNSVKNLREDLVKQHRGCDLQFAFVRYTDYDVTCNRTTHLDFTNDESQFNSFVGGISAQGGGDGPEDVMGGLQVALNKLTWRSKSSRVLVHIADCPCHGRMYHDNMGDNYLDGDRDGITHQQMMTKVKNLDIDYWFGYIDREKTDKMISIFSKYLQEISNQHHMIRQFDAMNPSDVEAAVCRSVSASIIGTAFAMRAPLRTYKLDPIIPNWRLISQTEGEKSPAIGIKSLPDLQAGLTLTPPSIPITFKCAPNPFAEGSECIVYHGYDLTSKRAIALKRYKRVGAQFNSPACYMYKIKVRAICTTYATLFNDKTKPPGSARLEVTPVDVVSCPGQDHYLLETFLDGKVEKYSNNAGVVCSESPHSELLQSFSHFTWVVSRKSLVICDLQGIESGSYCVTLIDPAINSLSAGFYGQTDLGRKGIERFFETHQCGKVCRAMGLSGQLL